LRNNGSVTDAAFAAVVNATAVAASAFNKVSVHAHTYTRAHMRNIC
jgi:hypothetical protein